MPENTREDPVEGHDEESSSPVEDGQKRDEDLKRGIAHLDPNHQDFYWPV